MTIRLSQKILFLLVVVLMLSQSAGVAFAQTSGQLYKGTLKTQVSVKEDLSAQVNMTLDLTNISQRQVISKLDFFTPQNPQNISATFNNKAVSASLSNGHIVVDLGSSPLLIGSSGIMSVNYRVEKFVNTQQIFKNLYWPKLSVETDLKTQTDFYFPKSWGLPGYVSRESLGTTAEGQISFAENKDVYLVWGKAKSLELEYKLLPKNDSDAEQTLLVPIPNKNFASIVFTKNTGAESAQFDESSNQFEIIKIASKQTGFFEANLKVALKDINFETAQKHDSIYFADAGKFSLKADEDAYAKVLSLNTADSTTITFSRQSVAESLAATKQTSLEYAQALVAAYHSQNVPAEIVYGFINMPFVNKFVWHFWVVKKEGDKFIQQDPYLQDVFGFNFKDGVLPDSLAMGILPDNRAPQQIGLANLTKLEELLKFSSDEIELKKEGELTVSLSLDGRAFAGENLPLSLKITNNSNQLAYITDLTITGTKINKDQLSTTVLLPNSLQVIKIPGIREGNIFTTGSKEIKGEVNIEQEGKTQSFPFNNSVRIEVDLQQQVLYFLGSTALLAGVINLVRYLRKYT